MCKIIYTRMRWTHLCPHYKHHTCTLQADGHIAIIWRIKVIPHYLLQWYRDKYKFKRFVLTSIGGNKKVWGQEQSIGGLGYLQLIGPVTGTQYCLVAWVTSHYYPVLGGGGIGISTLLDATLEWFASPAMIVHAVQNAHTDTKYMYKLGYTHIHAYTVFTHTYTHSLPCFTLLSSTYNHVLLISPLSSNILNQLFYAS